jgi:hypothetical protein
MNKKICRKWKWRIENEMFGLFEFVKCHVTNWLGVGMGEEEPKKPCQNIYK